MEYYKFYTENMSEWYKLKIVSLAYLIHMQSNSYKLQIISLTKKRRG